MLAVSTAQLPQLQAWLQQHAGQISSLGLCRGSADSEEGRLQLPAVTFSQLQSLQLSRMLLQLPDAAAAAAASTAEAPARRGRPVRGRGRRGGRAGTSAQAAASSAGSFAALRSLQLQDCTLQDLRSFTRLVWPDGLTTLALSNVSIPSNIGYNSSVTSVIASVLQQRPNLQKLQLLRMPIGMGAVQHVTDMQSLQALQLSFDDSMRSDNEPSTLPASLTKLVLGCDRDQDVDEENSYPKCLSALSQLQQLRVLELSGVVFDPEHMANMSQLQRLCLSSCQLLPYEEDNDGTDAEGTIALLCALKHLTNLEHISLQLDRLDFEQDAALFAGLTVSNKLTCLEVDAHEYQPLPVDAVYRMFDNRQPLLQLQQLRLSVTPKDGCTYNPQEEDVSCIDSTDLESLVHGCPALCELNLRLTVSPETDVSPLLNLKECRALTIGGPAFGDAEAKVVAQLTQLTALQWEYSPGITDTGLEMLTRLTNLERLFLEECHGISGDIDDMARYLEMTGATQWMPGGGERKVPLREELDYLLDRSSTLQWARRQQRRDLQARVARAERRLQRLGGGMVQKILYDPSSDEGTGSDEGSG